MGQERTDFVDNTSQAVNAAYLNNLGHELNAVARSTNTTSQCERRSFYRNKADTASPAAFDDTGQAVVYSTGSYPYQINTGLLTANPAIGSAYFNYRDFPASGPVTRAGGVCKFLNPAFGRTTGNGAINCSILNDTHGNQSLTSFRIGVHVVVSPFGWTIAKATNASGTLTFSNIGAGGGTFATPLIDFTRLYRFDMIRDGATVQLNLPDGTIAYYTDTDIASWSGAYGFHELAVGNGLTDLLPGWSETWADVGPQYYSGEQLVSRQQTDLSYQPLDADLTAWAAKRSRGPTSVTNTTTWTINTDLYEYAENTGLTATVAIGVTGTPTIGEKLWVSLTGTASRAITHSAAFEASGTVALPTTTSGTTRMDIGYMWNTVTSKWRIMGVA